MALIAVHEKQEGKLGIVVAIHIATDVNAIAAAAGSDVVAVVVVVAGDDIAGGVGVVFVLLR